MTKVSGLESSDLAHKIKLMYPRMNLTFSVNTQPWGFYAIEDTGNGFYIIAFSKNGQILNIKGLKSGKPFKKKPKFI